MPIGFALTVPDDLIFGSDEEWEKDATSVSKTFTAALRIKRARMLCERDGHVDAAPFNEIGACARCKTITNHALWSKAGGDN